jgi:phosphoribosyl 1,2-cyclic phosphodiesterase
MENVKLWINRIMRDNNYKKFTMITDTGYVSDRMKGMIQGSDAFMFERDKCER